MDDIHKLLENDFWADSSDDEGIGSDESLDLSDQYGSDRSDTMRKSKQTFEKISAQTSNTQDKSLNPSKQSVSVKKLGKILKRSITAKESLIISPIESRKVFGIDLIEHLEQTSAVVPNILKFCSANIEENGVIDGVYRLSGHSGHIASLRQIFQEGKVPNHEDEEDIHSVASLLKLYFRLLPTPLLTFPLYKEFLRIARMSPNQHPSFLKRTVSKLPKPHLQTLSHLIKHLYKLSLSHQMTGMTSRNLAIVWAPNLLRPRSQDCLKDCGMQAIVIESLILHCQDIFESVCDYNKDGLKTVVNKEVSIDQAVARAESFKPKTERKILRSISCARGLQSFSKEGQTLEVFQGRGVTLKRDRSLVGEKRIVNLKHPSELSDPKSDNALFGQDNFAFDTLCERHKEVVNNMNMQENKVENREIPTTNDSSDNLSSSERSGRSRLKSHLHWFRTQSRSRLMSFVSDDLRSVREGLRRSRDRLSSQTASAASCLHKRRSGSYNLNNDAREVVKGTYELETVINDRKEKHSHRRSKTGSTKKVLVGPTQTSHGQQPTALTTLTRLNKIQTEAAKIKSGRKEEDADLVFKQFETLELEIDEEKCDAKSDGEQDQDSDVQIDFDHCYQNILKHSNNDRELNFDQEETFYENIEVRHDNVYENVLFIDEREASDHADATENGSVYDRVNILRNCVKEVNNIVNQNQGQTSYKKGEVEKEGKRQQTQNEKNNLKSLSKYGLSEHPSVVPGTYYAHLVNTQ
eukprot:TRINITY_DN34363_c0_g1_i1.p1 TRINITY_DN34363_c0_g1~~TRINITY_DN34363_c0_g1_i1.p1  ORF type:complete len:771 (-),score=201.78 TRINITY_DN34363_c0_g1_i1:18-2267(-)